MTESYTSSSSHAGGFSHTSPLAPSSRDPLIALSSHCLRDAFGPSVQLVADALQTRGHPIAFINLISYMKKKCPAPQRRLGIPVAVQPTDPGVVRAALLTLVQHGIVSVSYQKRAQGVTSITSSPIPVYTYLPKAARNVMRYAKYIEFMRRAVDETTAMVLQTLLVAGQLRTTDWIARVPLTKDTTRQHVVTSAYNLVSQGYVYRVKPWQKAIDDDDDEEFVLDKEPPTKRIRLQIPSDGNEDLLLLKLLDGNIHYQSALPVEAVWRLNCEMFHDQLCAFSFGRLVSERFGSIVQLCGSMVTAALRHRAHQKHVVATLHGVAFEASSDLVSFQASDCTKYLPKPIVQALEKKPGGLKVNMKRSWDDIAELTQQPAVVRRSSDKLRYEVNLPCLFRYLQERAMHQLIFDRHGEIAARLISILLTKKWLESDALADQAMVPAKETREVCHELYRSRYIELMQLSAARQHNPAHTIYLWGVDLKRLRKRCTEDVATSLHNVRLRRQHEIEEVGRHWLERERSQQIVEADENDNEQDRINYEKFKHGLERLEVAAMQLDESLLLMNDFQAF